MLFNSMKLQCWEIFGHPVNNVSCNKKKVFTKLKKKFWYINLIFKT